MCAHTTHLHHEAPHVVNGGKRKNDDLHVLPREQQHIRGSDNRLRGERLQAAGQGRARSGDQSLSAHTRHADMRTNMDENSMHVGCLCRNNTGQASWDRGAHSHPFPK